MARDRSGHRIGGDGDSSDSKVSIRVLKLLPWQRSRVQLGGALFFATIVPFSVAAALAPQLATSGIYAVCLVGSIVGVVLCFWFTRSLNTFPGAGIGLSIVPITTTCFLVVFGFFFALRLDYSRPLLVTTWLISAAWFYCIHALLVRNLKPNFAVVPLGRALALHEVSGATWTTLISPALPARCSGIAADFESGLGPEWEHFLSECALQGTPVFHYKHLRETLTGMVEIEHLSQNAFGSLVPNSSYLTIKAIGDVTASAIALILLLPILLIVALLIRIDSKGPIFYKQKRVGFRGKIFGVWKFRTMRVRPAPEGEATARRDAITSDNDPRITAIGRLLRRSRIDELPQLWNVIRGDMSLIGPRPEAEVLARWYEEEIPFYRYRHIVRPGISGWAQVSQGHVAGVEDVITKLNYDFYYISNFGFWIDFLVFLKTVITMLSGFGSR